MNAESSSGKPNVSLLTATCLVVANMVGTGIFTSLGFQVGDLPSGFAIMALWLIGGICALCGALAYAELGAALPRSGGEYHFLGRIFHPALGFLAGWISATVGFAAPVALAAMAFGKYLMGATGTLPTIAIGSFHLAPETWIALALVAISTVVLLRDIQVGSAFQNGSTLLKVALILVVIVAGFLATQTQAVSFLPVQGDGKLIASAPFAVSLVYVMYSYSGWNASTYIVGELRNPARSIPLSVGFGTAAVIVLYLAVNAVFLRTTPTAEMAGKPEVALVAGEYIFGGTGSKVVALLICLGLISTVSAMMWIGPRVTNAMGEDLRALGWLGRKNAHGVPATAILVQTAITIVMLLTSTFEQVVTYVQFALQSCSFLTVLGLIVLRVRHPELPRPYKTWGYPYTPLLFLTISAWMLVYIFISKPAESMWGLITMAAGLVIYVVSPKNKPTETTERNAP